MHALRKMSWSPYVVGAGIGVLSWFAFATANRPLGITTAFENTAALGVKTVAPPLARTHGYYLQPEHQPKIGWEWMLVLGVFLGALASSLISGDRERLRVPALWADRFGAGKTARYLAAFGGGALMMFGSRLARGCTSGHAISGALQLAVSSWVFAVLIFIVAIITAHLLYARQEARHV